MPDWWKVPPEWVGETAIILAGGPSLTREQVDYVQGKGRVIAINNQAIDTPTSTGPIPAMAPWADVLYAADQKWWAAYKKQVAAFSGRKVTIKDHQLPGVHALQMSTEPVFDPRPSHLVTGGNSGYQAIHLAVHFGARRIILLGYDMKVGPKKERHWFGNHPGNLNVNGNFVQWMRSFARLAIVLKERGVEVTNCTASTALTCFPQAKLENTL